MRSIISLVFLLMIAGCNPNPASTISYNDLPAEGDAAHGEVLFNQVINDAPACSACHNDTGAASPNLDGFGTRAGSTVEGESAREYAFYSIAEPGRHIVDGYGNAMYNQYDDKLSEQDIADLIAYMLSL